MILATTNHHEKSTRHHAVNKNIFWPTTTNGFNKTKQMISGAQRENDLPNFCMQNAVLLTGSNCRNLQASCRALCSVQTTQTLCCSICGSTSALWRAGKSQMSGNQPETGFPSVPSLGSRLWCRVMDACLLCSHITESSKEQKPTFSLASVMRLWPLRELDLSWSPRWDRQQHILTKIQKPSQPSFWAQHPKPNRFLVEVD